MSLACLVYLHILLILTRKTDLRRLQVPLLLWTRLDLINIAWTVAYLVMFAKPAIMSKRVGPIALTSAIVTSGLNIYYFLFTLLYILGAFYLSEMFELDN